MQQSPYVHNVPAILADMERERQVHKAQQQAGGLPPYGDKSPQGGSGQRKKVYVYRTDTGGMVFSPTKLGEQEEDTHLEEDQQPQTIVDNEEPAPPPQTQPTKQREPSHILHVALVLFLFLFLDSIGASLTNLFTPVANVTITPNINTVSLHSTAQLGKLLDPITLSESQTVPTTGHGHQDAAAAGGTLTFYNAAFTVQTIDAGTIFTGQDGVQVITSASVTIAANNPPSDGVGQVLAHALHSGAQGNIPTLDINGTFANVLYVKNLTAFTGGLDSRDYMVVTKKDIDSAAKNLQGKVTASMTAALQEQLTPTEQIQKVPCTPTITASNAIGDEAAQVQVTVSETCTAIAYDTDELMAQATRQLTTQAGKTLGRGYQLYGNAKVSVLQATNNNKTVVLSFITQGIYVYQLNAKEQERIKTLITGKSREAALHQLITFPGIHAVNISGIPDNQQIPDPNHIHLLIVFLIP